MISPQASILTLFRETFEGRPEGADGTWFVEKREAIFPAIDSTSPEKASYKPNGETASIAAHVIHLTYYLSLTNAAIRGEHPTSDWEGSWKIQAVNDEEWQVCRQKLQKEYNDFCGFLGGSQGFEEQDHLTWAIANVAHAAFHLGAIRQLVKL